MNTRKLYILGLFLGVVCGVSASMRTMTLLSDYGVVCEKGSRLAKDAKLSELYSLTLADLSELQGTAEMVRELHALTDWTGLKKGEAPRHFHKRLDALKKMVRHNEWLITEQKKLLTSLIDRLGRKKQRHSTEAAVFGSLTAAAVVACLSAAVFNNMKKNTEENNNGGGNEARDNETNGSHSGGIGNSLPSQNVSGFDLTRLPDPPTSPLVDTYGPVPQHHVGVPICLQ